MSPAPHYQDPCVDSNTLCLQHEGYLLYHINYENIIVKLLKTFKTPQQTEFMLNDTHCVKKAPSNKS